MGMTIEEIIKSFDYIKHVGNGESEYKHCVQGKALDEAVTIMRKYQKIEQIYQKWNEYNDFSYNQAMREIGEVLEDGKQ